MFFRKINKKVRCGQKLQNSQCRTCYSATTGLRNLYDLTKWGCKFQNKSYAELVTEVSNINIMDDSSKELPQFICECCSRKLKIAHTFIQQIYEVNKRLMAMLTGQEDTEKQLDCLQETQVDIQSCVEIKMEDDDAIAYDETCEKIVYPEIIAESAVLLQNSLLNADVFCDTKKFQKIGDIESVDFEKTDSDLSLDANGIKNINDKDFLNVKATNETEMKPSSKALEELLQPKDSDNGGVENHQAPNIDRQRENISVNSKTEENKLLKKPSKSVEMSVKPHKDDDVAVPCSQCDKIFSNSKALMRHQRTSHIPEDQKCICPLCFRKFSRSCNMYTHMRTFHGPDTVPLIRKPSKQERIFQCDKCPRNYIKKKHLNTHVKNKHNNENDGSAKRKDKSEEDIKVPESEIPVKPNKPKRYEVRSLCSICGSSFSSKTHLIVHMRRHTGERPFKCDLCDRAYPRISELTCHRRIHTGEKPFACKICGKTFRVSSKMTTHMRSHTDIRPYKCAQCERSFKYSKDLSIHFRIHTGERPYSCNVCSSTFTQSNTLKAHRIKLGHMDNIIENTNKFV